MRSVRRLDGEEGGVLSLGRKGPFMKLFVWTAVALVALPLSAVAQAPAPDAPPAPPTDTAAPPAATAEPPASTDAPATSAAPAPPPKPKGDVVTLTSGTVLSGVQILRRTPTDFRVEISDSSVTLDIPRSLVKSVEYDDFNPSDQRTGDKAKNGKEPLSEITAQKLSPALSAKLREPLDAAPVKYDNKDLLEVLADIAQRKQIAASASAGVQAIPQAERLWTVEVAPATQLFALLREQLPARFPNFEVVFEGDSVVVMTKEEANARAETPPPPPPPGAPPAATPMPPAAS